jgi:hypothetical protein
MLKKLTILLGIFLFLIPVTVMGTQPSQSTSHVTITPLYRESMASNTNYTYTMTVNPPDGITSVLTAIIFFNAQINGQSQNFTLWVNNKPCNNPFYYIATAYSATGNTQIYFDCSNIITKSGNYNITIRSAVNTGVISGWLDLTYMNNPIGNMEIAGTEYVLGQNGTLFIKLLDSNELPINSGFCSLNVYYPNKTIKFMDNSPTTFLENGLYYKDFFVPNTEGLYIADANCIYADTIFRYNLPSEDCGYSGSISGGTSPQPVTFQNVDCTPFYTTGGINGYQNWTFNYTSIGVINLSTISQIDVNWVGQLGGATNYLQLYNWNTSAWDNLGSYVASTGGVSIACGNNVYITRSATSNITSYVINNTIKTRIFISAAAILTDAVEIIFHNNGSVVASLRGSSEVHVNNYFNQTSNLTVNLNQTQINQILSAINSVNATANETLSYAIELNQSVFSLNQSQYNYFQQILALLQDINHTLNTTLEYKLDLINGTVTQINQTIFDTLQYLVGMNNSITQYLVVINGTVHEINQSQYQHYLSLLQAINYVNFTANTTLESKLDYLNNTVIPLLYEINATGNTTLELVASINQTLWNDIFVILKDINFTTNTTLENKLDLINYTTWQSWIMLQNLTIGNVSVTASVNWTEGVPYIWNYSNPALIQHDLLALSNQGIELVTESYVCLNNVTLQTTMNVTNCIEGTCQNYVRPITKICEWGCANNQCLPQPSIQYGLAIAVIFLLIGILYMGWRATRG